MASSAETRKYDVTIYGATGFTGKLCLEYLVSHPSSPSWAVAGRSQSKLEALKRDYKLAKDVGVFQADNSIEDDAKSGLLAMVTNSRVVLNLVGPYGLHGSFRLAKLCAENGTSYTDLSGESLFNAQLQEQLDGVAKSTGAILIPSVGFDSVPADIATYLAVRRVRQRAAEQGIQLGELDAKCGNIVMGGASGGTLASMNHMAADKGSAWQLKAERPLAIAARGSNAAATSRSRVYAPNALWMPHFGAYAGFFPLGTHNARVVYQSASHLDAEGGNRTGSVPLYGPHFQYADVLVTTTRLPRVLSWLLAQVLSFFAKAFLGLVFRSNFVRKATAKVLPAGTGPSEKARRTGFLDLRSLVVGYPVASGSGQKSTQVVAATGRWVAKKADPGYLMTSRVATEVSLFLALEARKQKTAASTAQPASAGVRTTASLGAERVDALVDRLHKYAKVDISVQDWTGKTDAKTLGARLETL